MAGLSFKKLWVEFWVGPHNVWEPYSYTGTVAPKSGILYFYSGTCMHNTILRHLYTYIHTRVYFATCMLTTILCASSDYHLARFDSRVILHDWACPFVLGYTVSES